MRAGGGLTVVGHRRPLLPLHDVENGSVVGAETGMKLGTPFKDIVRLFGVKF